MYCNIFILIRGKGRGYLRNKRYSLTTTTYVFNAAKLKQTRHTDIPISTMHGKRPKSGPSMQMTILRISSGISLTHIYPSTNIHKRFYPYYNRLNLLPELLITYNTNLIVLHVNVVALRLCCVRRFVNLLR